MRFMKLLVCVVSKPSTFIFSPVVTTNSRPMHWESRSYQHVADLMSDKERLDFISAYYAQTSVDVAAAKQEVLLTPESLLYTGKNPNGNHLLHSAHYIHKELPVRMAHRITDFRTLPFVIGCNPTILAVHNMYLKTFRRLTEVPPIVTQEDEAKFSSLLRELLNEHNQVLSMLAKGFKECRSRIKDVDQVTQFLNRILTSRLAARMLVEHHLALREHRPNHIGIIDLKMSLTEVVKRQVEMVSGMFQLEYGVAPTVVLTGQTNLVFPYIRMPLDYILTELLKNAFRATIESKARTAGKVHPVHITLASDEVDFWIRISDHAGGVPSELEHTMWNYHISSPSAARIEAGWESAIGGQDGYSVVKAPDLLPPPTATGGSLDEHIILSAQKADDIELPSFTGDTSNMVMTNKIFSEFTEHHVTKSIHGFGFGLPLSRAYARHLGGDLNMYTMRSIGTDCYLRLRHIDGKAPSFRI